MTPSVDAVILCGGRGSRMQGEDKGLLPLAGRPLYQHVLASLPREQLGQVFLSANRNLSIYAESGLAVLPDVRPGFPGPMAGIEAAMLHSQADWLLVLPCDMPSVPEGLLPRLWAARGDAPGIRVREDVGPHPLLCLLQRSLLGSLQSAMDQGRLAVGRWQDEVGVREVLFAGHWANCNTPAQLAGEASTDA